MNRSRPGKSGGQRFNQLPSNDANPPSQETSLPVYVKVLIFLNFACAGTAVGLAVASWAEAQKDLPSDQSTFHRVNDRLETLHAGLEVAVHPTCRLVYTDDDDQLSESQMQEWIKDTSWKVGVPYYSQVRRACVCQGSDDSDPIDAEKGTTPAWVSPGDLVFLVQEGILESTSLPSDFVSKHGTDFSPSRHVKVCLDQASLAHLWEYDGTTHCHEKNSDGSVARIFTGWDGDLFCGRSAEMPSWIPTPSADCPSSLPSSQPTAASNWQSIYTTYQVYTSDTTITGTTTDGSKSYAAYRITWIAATYLGNCGNSMNWLFYNILNYLPNTYTALSTVDFTDSDGTGCQTGCIGLQLGVTCTYPSCQYPISTDSCYIAMSKPQSADSWSGGYLICLSDLPPNSYASSNLDAVRSNSGWGETTYRPLWYPVILPGPSWTNTFQQLAFPSS